MLMVRVAEPPSFSAVYLVAQPRQYLGDRSYLGQPSHPVLQRHTNTKTTTGHLFSWKSTIIVIIIIVVTEVIIAIIIVVLVIKSIINSMTIKRRRVTDTGRTLIT